MGSVCVPVLSSLAFLFGDLQFDQDGVGHIVRIIEYARVCDELHLGEQASLHSAAEDCKLCFQVILMPSLRFILRFTALTLLSMTDNSLSDDACMRDATLLLFNP